MVWPGASPESEGIQQLQQYFVFGLVLATKMLQTQAALPTREKHLGQPPKPVRCPACLLCCAPGETASGH
jgi:hypothetical protein